ncbi:MAG: transposase [Clostridiales bacterium]|nr:transposase [Clostridiales bacterium]
MEVVSRDGSITYHNAISTSHPDVVQVSDRFHLLKNLTSYSIDCLKKTINPYVLIPGNQEQTDTTGSTEIISRANQNRKLTLEEKYIKVEEFKLHGMTKTTLCKLLNMDIRVYNKLQQMHDLERNSVFITRGAEISLEKEALKMEKVEEVRNLK